MAKTPVLFDMDGVVLEGRGTPQFVYDRAAERAVAETGRLKQIAHGRRERRMGARVKAPARLVCMDGGAGS